MSFQTKLVISLILVIVLTTVLGYVLINTAINKAFSRFAAANVGNQDRVFQQILAEYYARTGSWKSLNLLLIRNQARLPFFVADENGFIVSGPDFQLIGNKLSRSELSLGSPIVVDNKTVGTLIPRAILQLRDPVEKQFLGTVSTSLWASGLIVSIIGILISFLLVRQLAGPLRRLNTAAEEIASGELATRVDVHTQDELGHLGQSFNKMAQSLQKSEQAKRQMIADVSHELRTPITSVRAGLEAMRDGLLKTTPENIAALHDKVLLTTRIVADLQQLALADAGQLSINKQHVDLKQLIEKIRATIGVEIEDRGITLQVNLPPDLPPVYADSQRIEQVILNLLSNAIRYTPSVGLITIAAVKMDNLVQVSVCDNGPGLSQEDLDHVFDRFYRANAARMRDENGGSTGAGLGLAISKALIEAHGGQIWAENAASGGACFRFSLSSA
jgi:signal transduction histidine kinase